MREPGPGDGVAEEAVGVREVVMALGEGVDGYSTGGVDGGVAPVVGGDLLGEEFHFFDEGWDVAEVFLRRWCGSVGGGGGAAEECGLVDAWVGE